MKLPLLCLAALVLGADMQESFVDFVKTYNKQYSVEEFFSRFEIFKSNMALAKEHNAKNKSWTMGVTQFADLTGEEFTALYMGKVFKKSATLPKRTQGVISQRVNDDPAFDWRTKGAISPVRNQGQCGSCWAMTVVAAVESACYILTHNLTMQSTQALMDCSSAAGNQGCNGGFIDDTFTWMASNPLPEDSCYPYTAESGKCKKTCPPIKWCKVTGFKDVPKGDEAAMMTALNQQPLALAVEAATTFQMYTGGVIDKKDCGTQLDHTLLLIGYGTDANLKYWTLQNTWGSSWGEQGYVRLIRDKDECGIADMVSYPTVTKA